MPEACQLLVLNTFVRSRTDLDNNDRISIAIDNLVVHQLARLDHW
jgi:hypothetical protein